MRNRDNSRYLDLTTEYYQANKSGKYSIGRDQNNNFIQGDIENKAYHIQTLLADELDKCKGKGNTYAEKHIKEIQDAYKQEDPRVKQLIIVDKEEQQKDQIQDKEVFLYKSYNILLKSSKTKTSEPTFI